MMFFVPSNRTARRPSPPPDETGRALDCAAALAALGRGATEALAPLYRAHAAPVYRYALALCGNEAWAADVTQEAFVALAEKPGAFDATRGTLGAYLAGIARHALAARWREAARLDSLDDEGDEPAADAAEAAGPGPVSPETLLVRAQDRQALWLALRRLPGAFREAVVLVDLQDRPYAEAAQIAGIEINTLRTRLHRGRLRLAALLGAEGSGR
jgi:RNA polymerase sigma-70 factor, ECF subfamily